MTTYLKQITLLKNKEKDFPFNIQSYKKGIDIHIKSSILILVWENGAGKSTLLEAIAGNCGFSVDWWNQNHFYWEKTINKLSKCLRLSWLPKINKGFFMRAESFLSFSKYIDKLAKDDIWAYESY